MMFILYSFANDDSIGQELGMPEYSYYFVLKQYQKILEKMGEVVITVTPDPEVDAIYDICVAKGVYCVFLSFTPPHKTRTDFKCPTIPVFAWEYSTIPTESWKGDLKHDWRNVLGQQGWAITHSAFSVAAVKRAIRDDFPVISIPSPVWDQFNHFYHPSDGGPQLGQFELCASREHVFDTSVIGFSHYRSDDYSVIEALQQESKQTGPVVLEGVVYTSIFNPYDGRKNWTDLLWAFCWAFRDCEDATLVIKLTYNDFSGIGPMLYRELLKLTPFKCRVIAIHGFLQAEEYARLVERTTYIVNSAYGEGQCLPLMEFMSAGKPAVAPNHTAMADYIDERSAFVVRSSAEWTHWPHDPRAVFRTFRYKVDWESLRDAYLESYRVAQEEGERYKEMSRCANSNLKSHCSQAVATKRMRKFIKLHRKTRAQMNASLPGFWDANLFRVKGKIRRMVGA